MKIEGNCSVLPNTELAGNKLPVATKNEDMSSTRVSVSDRPRVYIPSWDAHEHLTRIIERSQTLDAVQQKKKATAVSVP